MSAALVDVLVALMALGATVLGALVPRHASVGRRRLRRLVDVAATAATAVVLVGVATAVVPGDPVARALGEDAPESARAAMAETMGLHHRSVLPAGLVPLAVGGRVLSGLVRGLVDDDAGLRSFRREPVWSVIGPRLLSSLRLGALALGLGVVLGILLGALAGLRHGRPGGGAVELVVVGLAALPRVVLGPALVAVVAVAWRLLPAGGDDDGAALVLPTLCLALPFAGVVARHVRVAVVDVVDEPFIRAARSRGAGPVRVAVRHVLPHALLPVVHLTGLQAGALLSGAVVVERVFSWPGLGTLMVERLQLGDLPVVVAIVAVSAVLVVAMNLVADAVAVLVDPRLRRGRTP